MIRKMTAPVFALVLSLPRLATRKWRIPSLDRTTLASAGSILAAASATACCVVPLVLLSFGVTGAWLANFNALYPYKPYLIGIALVLLAARFIWVWRKRRECREKEIACPATFTNRFNAVAVWVSTVLIAVAIGLPYAAPWLLRGS